MSMLSPSDNDDLDKLLAGLHEQTVNPYGLKRVGKLSRNQYHHAEEDTTSRVPGLILPEGAKEGASAAFDVNTPISFRINPSTLGEGGFELDLSLLTEAEREAATQIAMKEFPANPQARAIAAYAIMAKVAAAKDKSGRVSAAAISPAIVAKPAPPSQSVALGSILAMFDKPAVPEGSIVQPATSLRRVDFEFPRPIGTIKAYYNEIVITKTLLVLANRLDATHMKWFPEVDPDDQFAVEEPAFIGVMVYDKAGQQEVAFKAVPSPVQFQFMGYELCVLAIEQSRAVAEKELIREQAIAGAADFG